MHAMRAFLLFLFSFFTTTSASAAFDSLLIAELNPAHFKTDFSAFDQRTASFCGQLSEVAYFPEKQIALLQDSLNTHYKKENVRFLNMESGRTNTRALLCIYPRHIIIAFRGTDFTKFKDILTDVNRRLFVNSDTVNEILRDVPGGHRGFRKGAAELIQNQFLFDTLAKYSQEGKLPIYLTGHSMGAGYASLFVQPIARRFKLGGGYNFAPPLTVYCPEADVIAQKYGGKVYDIVNYKDYVTRASSYLRRHMKHIGNFYRISKKQRLLYRERERYVGWIKGELGLRKILNYHTLNGYLEALRLPGNSNAAILERKRRGRVIFGRLYPPVSCKEANPKKIRFGF